MKRMDLLIKGGTVLFPDESREEKLNVGLAADRIACIGKEVPEACRVIEAEGLMVSPGFIDTHMHDEELDDPDTTQQALLRQGVTTGIAGNCGSGPLFAEILPTRRNPWIKLGYLTGHRVLRLHLGIDDEHKVSTKEEIEKMKVLLAEELEQGSFGLSFGLEYAPNTSPAEIRALVDVVKAYEHRWIPVHIRHDGPRCLEAVQEVIDLARESGLRFQISHTGSMTAFGQLAKALKMIERAVSDGIDVTFDCYPYDAFCTTIGSTVFDCGFEKRWNKGLESLEVATGKYRGQRMTQEVYEDLRANDPKALIIAHVMNDDEVRLCLKHPACAIASDSTLNHGEGHPRSAGAFPRALRILREEGFSWADAVFHATERPAQMGWFEQGRMAVGAPGDLTIFNPETLTDRATFKDQLLPPDGIEYVIIDGRVALDGGDLVADPVGRLIFRD
ncbi:MAG: amidohydrolase family protein [Thermovirga sp.]